MWFDREMRLDKRRRAERESLEVSLPFVSAEKREKIGGKMRRNVPAWEL
jgi:hypothetical protein